MGGLQSCCMDRRQEFNDPNKNKQQRLTNWRATGIVSLRGAKLRELPDMIKQISESIKTLDACNNSIKILPDYIGDMQAMTRLLLSDNQLTSLPKAIGQVQSLKILILDQNYITILPDSIGELVQLEKLSVSSNQLKELPKSIQNLTKLIQIDVSKNQLIQLPDEIGQCVMLESIEAQQNCIQQITKQIGQLQKLKSLNFDSNSIQQVPSEILTECTALHTLKLNNNQLTMATLEETEGYQQFEARRQKMASKQISSGVIIGSSLDEAIARRV